MRLLPLALLVASCAAPDPAAGYETSGLPSAEADAARAALERADVVITTDETPPRDFLGSAALVVEFGPDAAVVSLSFWTTPAAAAQPAMNLTLPIDGATASALAADGWSFEADTNVFAQDAIRGNVTHFTMHADADGLMFATLDMVDLDGASHVLTARGRISPGACALWSGGGPTTPEDIATCNAVIGSLRPPTERPARGPTR